MLNALVALAASAGLQNEAPILLHDFDEYWRPFTLSHRTGARLLRRP
jgi:hypothetical protein